MTLPRSVLAQLAHADDHRLHRPIWPERAPEPGERLVCYGDRHRAALQVGAPEMAGTALGHGAALVERWADRQKRRQAEHAAAAAAAAVAVAKPAVKRKRAPSPTLVTAPLKAVRLGRASGPRSRSAPRHRDRAARRWS
jgi:hypothetical protein